MTMVKGTQPVDTTGAEMDHRSHLPLWPTWKGAGANGWAKGPTWEWRQTSQSPGPRGRGPGSRGQSHHSLNRHTRLPECARHCTPPKDTALGPASSRDRQQMGEGWEGGKLGPQAGRHSPGRGCRRALQLGRRRARMHKENSCLWSAHQWVSGSEGWLYLTVDVHLSI